MSKYQHLIEALEATVQAAHSCGLPHLAGQLYSVRDIQDEAGLARLEDRLLTVFKLLQLRGVPQGKRAKMGAAASILAQAVQDARYL